MPSRVERVKWARRWWPRSRSRRRGRCHPGLNSGTFPSRKQSEAVLSGSTWAPSAISCLWSSRRRRCGTSAAGVPAVPVATISTGGSGPVPKGGHQPDQIRIWVHCRRPANSSMTRADNWPQSSASTRPAHCFGLTNVLVMFGGSKDGAFNQEISDLVGQSPCRPADLADRRDGRPHLLRRGYRDPARLKRSAGSRNDTRWSSPRTANRSSPAWRVASTAKPDVGSWPTRNGCAPS